MDYRTKEDYVAEFLREGIISGRFERGERLKQAELAEMLRLSITPVREAMKLLEAEGYVTRESHHGVTVSRFDRDSSGDVIGLRMQLEERLVRAAMIHLDAPALAELQELEHAFEKAVAAGDRTNMRGINYRFHRRLYAQAQLPQTLHFVQILWAKYPFDVINVLKGRAERAVQEHRLLMRYLSAGEADKAAEAVRKHIEQGWSELQRHMGDGDRAGDEPAPPAKSAPRKATHASKKTKASSSAPRVRRVSAPAQGAARKEEPQKTRTARRRA